MNIQNLNKISLAADRRYVLGALALVIGLMSFYVYFLSASVIHVVIRKESQQEINKLHTEISHLEAEYIAAQHSMSAEIASLDGYVAIDDKIFIDRNDDTKLVLSTVGNR